jgi:glycine/D-amino acid oxidase-like deaminating enzyme/nitrite reductase/ring-hydroxylating ferredoxin subunit
VNESYRSYWSKSASGAAYPALETDRSCDVAVLGGGIVGVTAALELAKAGAEVVLLEARRIGSGASGYNTGKVSSLNGLIYQQLVKRFGTATATAYGSANEAGLGWVAANVERHGIDCDLRRKPNLTYTESEHGRKTIIAEAEAAREAGLTAELVEDENELPFRVNAAVRFEEQIQFHPLRYLHGIAAAAAEAGCAIHEQSRAVSVAEGNPCRIEIAGGATLRADRVLVATHLPILDRGLYFARTHPERSYVIAARLRGDVPQGMYLSDESPSHSLRALPTPEGELLMVGGESHKTGQSDARDRYVALEEWARRRFDVASIEHRWATQDHIPIDKLPFVGPLWPRGGRLLTATGLQKWGLAMGTAAGVILADLALTRESAWGDAFPTARFDPRRGAASFVKENVDDGARFLLGRLAGRRRSAVDLAPGEGAVVGQGLGQQAAYRDDDGELHQLSARCTHLGCVVSFNAAERTWDCPCHGSRFDARDGEVLECPAVRPLSSQRSEN